MCGHWLHRPVWTPTQSDQSIHSALIVELIYNIYMLMDFVNLALVQIQVLDH